MAVNVSTGSSALKSELSLSALSPKIRGKTWISTIVV